jgi:hypothetical protein
VSAYSAGRRHADGAAPGLRLLRRALLAWCVILVAAFASGILREVLLEPTFGASRAQLISIVLLLAVLLLAARWLVRVTRPRRPLGHWFLVGLLWAALTVSFEFPFFHYVAGVSWSELLAAYDIRRGGYSGVVVLAILLAPPAVAYARRR